MPVEFSCLAIKTKLDVLIKFLRGKIALSKLSTSNYRIIIYSFLKVQVLMTKMFRTRVLPFNLVNGSRWVRKVKVRVRDILCVVLGCHSALCWSKHLVVNILWAETNYLYYCFDGMSSFIRVCFVVFIKVILVVIYY